MAPGQRTASIQVLMLMASIVSSCSPVEDRGPTATTYLQDAVEAGRWLQAQADDNWHGAIPDEVGRDSAFSASVGTGASGRVLFFLELFSATGDSTFLRSAQTEGEAAIRATDDGAVPPGLYNGLSGVAFALAELANRSPNPSYYRDTALRRFEEIVERHETDGDAWSWGPSNDVITGTAGVGLALLYAAREFDRSDFLDAARAAGVALLSVADTTEHGVRWFRFIGRELDLPNFSHGTAGVAYFLAALSEATGDDGFLDAARAGADYLTALADTSDGLFLVPYGVPNEGYVTRFDIGWAHGPAGTARLFYLLWRLTGEKHYRSAVDASARSILAAGVPGSSTDTLRWAGPFGVDRRFGISSAVPFLIDWYRVDGGPRYLESARASAEAILVSATSSTAGLSWTIPRFGFQGEGIATYTGYFYGSAGMGLSLLEMHYAETASMPAVRLPDDPFGG